MAVAMDQILEDLDFERFDHPLSCRPAYRIRCGAHEVEAVMFTNRWFQESYLVSGTVNTGRTIGMVESELPLEVPCREEGLALLGYFLAPHIPEPHKPPWLRIAERMNCYLPWSSKRPPPILQE